MPKQISTVPPLFTPVPSNIRDHRLVIDADAARTGYVDAVEAFREEYRSSCFRAGIDYVPLDTSMQFDRALMEYLVSRRNRF